MDAAVDWHAGLELRRCFPWMTKRRKRRKTKMKKTSPTNAGKRTSEQGEHGEEGGSDDEYTVLAGPKSEFEVAVAVAAAAT